MTPSDLERSYFFQLRAARLSPPELEYRFHPTRKWRFDFAWPDLLLAAELDGGTWSSGRHTRGPGHEKDCEKQSEAAILGWRILRFNNNMVTDGRALDMTMRAVQAAGQSKEQ